MKLHLETKIKAPVRKVWEILAHRFGDLQDWSDTVDVSRALDADEVPAGSTVAPEAPVPGRYIETKFGNLREILTDYDESEKEFTFLATDLPKIFDASSNRTRVVANDEKSCTVTFDITMSFKGLFKILSPLLKRRMSKAVCAR